MARSFTYLLVALIVLVTSYSNAFAETGVCPNPVIGTDCNFKGYDYMIYDTPAEESLDATLRGLDTHIYLFVENDLWNANTVTQAEVDAVVAAFSSATPGNSQIGIYQQITAIMGTPPNKFDSDDHIYVVVHSIASTTTFPVTAYFRELDLLDDYGDPMPGSNGHEVIFLDRKLLSQDERLSDLAGKLTDLIHWGQDKNETEWVKDLIARQMALMVGYETYKRPISQFAQSPSQPLIGQDISGITKLYHGATTLFGIYLEELFGSYFFEYLSSSKLIGEDSFKNAFELSDDYQNSFCDHLHNWSIQNAINRGTYSYKDYEPPTFNKTVLSDGSASPTLSQYAASFLDMDVSSVGINDSFKVVLDIGEDIGIKATAIKYNSTNESNVALEEVAILAGQPTTLLFDDLGLTYDKLMLVLTRCATGSPIIYNVQTEIIIPVDGDIDTEQELAPDGDDPVIDGDQVIDGDNEQDTAEQADQDQAIYGSKTCIEINVCHSNCTRASCFEDCILEGNYEAQSLWKDFQTCINGDYAGGTDCMSIADATERIKCMAGQCPNEYEACKLPDGDNISPDDLGSSSCSSTNSAISFMLFVLLFGLLALRKSRRGN